jgi:hypothetical protein
MQVSIILFQTDYDRFSALAVDIATQVPYTKVYRSMHEAIEGLLLVGVVTEREAAGLAPKLEVSFQKGAPVFKETVDDDALEEAGFVRAIFPKPN